MSRTHRRGIAAMITHPIGAIVLVGGIVAVIGSIGFLLGWW